MKDDYENVFIFNGKVYTKNMSEQLKTNGTIISTKNNVEVTFISKNGLILLVGVQSIIFHMESFHDVDLNLSIINNPDDYPLVAK